MHPLRSHPRYFGEIALLTRAPRTASVQVVSDKAELLVMHRDDFQTFMVPFQSAIQEQMEKRESQANELLGKAEGNGEGGGSSSMGFGVTATTDGDGNVASWLSDEGGSVGRMRGRNE